MHSTGYYFRSQAREGRKGLNILLINLFGRKDIGKFFLSLFDLHTKFSFLVDQKLSKRFHSLLGK